MQKIILFRETKQSVRLFLLDNSRRHNLDHVIGVCQTVLSLIAKQATSTSNMNLREEREEDYIKRSLR